MSFSKNPELKPNQLLSNFYIDFNKFTVLIGDEILSGVFPDFQTSIQEIKENFMKIFKEFQSCIFSYKNQNYGIWKIENVYQIFNSQSCDENGYPSENGACCSLRISDLEYLIEYLSSILSPTRGKYEIYSVKIIKIEELQKVPIKEPEKVSDKNNFIELVKISVKIPRPETVPEPEIPEIIESLEVPNKIPSDIIKPIEIIFNADYQLNTEFHGVLRASTFQHEKLHVPCTNVAAIVMHRISIPHQWTSKTVDEILMFGKKIYLENLQKIEGTEILPSQISGRVHYENINFEIEVEQIVYGELGSKNPKIVDLIFGIKEFFKIFDFGIIQGPQNVAIWQTTGLYFMFDAKQRNRLGQKWTTFPLSESGDSESSGKACVCWFKNLEDLTEIYMGNIPLKQRHDGFSISKLEVLDFKEVSENWYNWNSFGVQQWIIRGSFSQSHSQFPEEQRNTQGTCIAAIALVYSTNAELFKWNKDLVDEIIYEGNCFHSHSIEQLKKEDKFLDNFLKPEEISRVYNLRDQKIEFLIEQGTVFGTLFGNDESGILDLEQGFFEFFKHNEKGIFTSCGSSLAIWQKYEFYYVFDSHTRDSQGCNPLNCSKEFQLKKKFLIKNYFFSESRKKKSNLGTSCCVRFSDLHDMTQSVLSNLIIKSELDYNISRIVFRATDLLEGRPKLFNFSPLGEVSAILLANPGIHEGNAIFDIRANRQTLCNLLTAICVNQISSSRKWDRSDIYDIIKIGDKIFCKISNAKEDDNLIISWDHLDKKLQIGIYIFDFENEEKIGTFSASAPNIESSVGSFRQPSMLSVKSKSLSKDMSGSGTPSSNNMDLSEILEDWDTSESTDAILESKHLNVAIWKCNDLFYIFDPKTCKSNGILSDDRKQATHFIEIGESLEQKSSSLQSIGEEDEQEISHSNQTSQSSNITEIPTSLQSYVAWFTNLDSLANHILTNISENFLEDEFKLNHLKISHQICTMPAIPEQNWFSFNLINPGHWIVRASISQNNQIFIKNNRNYQDVTNSVVALYLASVCEPEEWTSIVLDVILKYGDRLYTKSFKKDNRKLNLDEIANPFIINRIRIGFSVVRTLSGDLTVPVGNKTVNSLEDSLNEFFDNSKELGILEAREYFLAIWKQNDSYFLFDPHEIGPDGRKQVNGVSCLSRFEKVKEMADYFLNNLMECDLGFNKFKIHSVSYFL